MAILVDDAIWPFRGGMYCHMMSDTAGPAGIAELHAFARKIGLKRSWFQNKPRHPHYDLSSQKRAQAIAGGAEAVTPLQLIERTKMVRRASDPLAIVRPSAPEATHV